MAGTKDPVWAKQREVVQWRMRSFYGENCNHLSSLFDTNVGVFLFDDWSSECIHASILHVDMHGSQTWIWELGWAEGSISHFSLVSFWLVCKVSHNPRACKKMWYPHSISGEGKSRIWWEGETGTEREEACQGMIILLCPRCSCILWLFTLLLDLLPK